MPLPLRDSEYLYGIHDPGGEHIMLEKGIPGWVLVTQAVGSDPQNHKSEDYRFLSDKGLGVMVRLNAGYGGVGTIPFERQYNDFAERCANFVGASQGAHIWIVGNEMNHPIEWPGADWDWNLNTPRPVSADTVGEQITPNRYAQCYRKVRDAIHALPRHEQDLVLVGAVAPWNAITRYSGNRHGDWIKYFQDILKRIDADQCDGITLHTYTHGPEPDKIDSSEKMSPPFQRRHYDFRTYRDFMYAIPKSMRKLPVYITETDQDVPWRDEDTGWVQRAYGEIDYWNQNHEQQIRALILYRWSQLDRWSIDGKQGVIEDFRNAMDFGYKPHEVILPKDEAVENRKPYRAEFVIAEPITAGIASNDIEVDLTIKNTGSNTWYKEGDDTFRVGYHWFDRTNHKAHAEDYRTELPKDVESDQEVTLPIKIGMPSQSGSYRLAIDMVHEGITWFAWRGNQSLAMKVIVLPSNEADEHYFPETNITVKSPFLDMLLKLGLDTAGYPTSDEIIEDEIVVQHFQWLTLEEHEPGEVRIRDTAEFIYDEDDASISPEQPVAGSPITPDEVDLGLPIPTIELIAQSLPRRASEMHTRTLDDIQHIVISHTGVRPGVSVERLAQAHLQNWPGIACHYLVEADGVIYQTCAITEIVNDQRHWIQHGMIVYVAGNFNDAVPTELQLNSLTELVAWILDAYHLNINNVFGASELIHTQSPGKQWSSGRRWKNVLLGRTRALLDAYPMRHGGGNEFARKPETVVGMEPEAWMVAPSTPVQKMQAQRSPQQQAQTKTIPKPAITNLVNQLPKHSTNRYDTRNLDQITHIAVHHSASPISVTPQRIDHYQVSSETHQWPGIGYHYFIDQDGTISHTQALELVSNHVFGHNDYTVGVCLAGDFDDVIPSPVQLAATGHLLVWLIQELNISLQNVWGHKDFPRTDTSCPGKQWNTEKCWRDSLIQQIRITQGSDMKPPDKVIDHYLLLRQSSSIWSREDWEQATKKYIARFRPTFGFSLTNAMMARRVTIVSSSLGANPEEETQLRQAGCWVERIAGRDIDETKQILDRLAESGQRFLEP